MKRLLIINADDLGMNAPRNHGIFQAFEFGVVSSASVIPTSTESSTAARHARERNLSVGLHLSLTEGFSLSEKSDISTLLKGNGEFHEPEKFKQLLSEGEIDPTHLEREIRAQFEWMLDCYGQPSHVDSHHHIHILPELIPLLLPILDRYSISFIRIPAEDPLPPFGYVISDEQLERCKKTTELALAARKHYEAGHLRTTDHFRGLTLSGNASQKNLRHIISRLPEGSTELMVHPSSMAAYGTPHDLDPQRQTELAMVLNDEVPGILKERGIQLGSFFDL